VNVVPFSNVIIEPSPPVYNETLIDRNRLAGGNIPWAPLSQKVPASAVVPDASDEPPDFDDPDSAAGDFRITTKYTGRKTAKKTMIAAPRTMARISQRFLAFEGWCFSSRPSRGAAFPRLLSTDWFGVLPRSGARRENTRHDIETGTG
jgi:hypothetical protein